MLVAMFGQKPEALRSEARSAPPETAPEPSERNQDGASPKPAEPNSPWFVRQDTSPMDDSTSVFLSTYSKELVPHKYRSGRAAPAVLQLRCMENTTALYIEFNGHYMVSSRYQDWGDVDLRVDAGNARTIGMHESTDNQVLGLFRGGQSIPVIKSMFGAEKLLVRATPFNESPITVTFDVSDLESEITPLREACHW
ncbi:type VI secretion system-associated protein TagO [uncultured Halomonas sp.]|uniref:type VI secretion system-associated protein TagO n=1 Tax=uncultured Halomonas sp. TaxID=173971 RepID=UPI0032B1F5F4